MDIYFLKGKDIAARLKISRALAYRLIAEGEIRSLRFGRVVRVSEADLQAFILSKTAGGGSGREEGLQQIVDNRRTGGTNDKL